MTDQVVGVLAIDTGPVGRCCRVDLGDSARDAVCPQGVPGWLSA